MTAYYSPDEMNYVLSKCCPLSVHLKHGAKQILAHDRARAQKLLRGLHPHGPVATWQARVSNAGGQKAQDVKPMPITKAAAAAAGHSIDVTDAGTLPLFLRILARLKFGLLRRDLYYVCWRWKASNSIQASDRYRYVGYNLCLHSTQTLLIRELEHVSCK